MVVFFYKKKTAYEMRISDLSSDVCSSDLTKDAVMIGDHREAVVVIEIYEAAVCAERVFPVDLAADQILVRIGEQIAELCGIRVFQLRRNGDARASKDRKSVV